MSINFYEDVNKEVSDFFNLHNQQLSKLYPGIKASRLIDAANDFLPLESIKSDYLYKHQSIEPLNTFFEKLLIGVPLEHITGKSYFYKSCFEVCEDVLIPRSETEILVEMAVEKIKISNKEKDFKLLDVGTGSGAIVLSILQDCDRTLKATASDISEKALKVAKRNYFNLEYTIPSESELEFIISDRLDSIDEKFHMIVSNPPYIKENQDKEGVHSQVLEYEPHLALFLEDVEYEKWFNSFINQVYNSLEIKGFFIMEGHEDHLESLKELTINIGFKNVKVINDYTQRNRFIIAQKE